jgi:hypothetical protein
MISGLTAALLTLCLIEGFGLYVLYQKYKSEQKKPQPTREAQELLHYLTKGVATVRIEVIDPSNLVLWRP